MITIDGTTYDVPITKLSRSADFLDRYATRTENGDLKRDLIGVYYNYQLEFGRIFDSNLYAALWDKLTAPQEFHTVTVYDERGNYTFTAYFGSITDEMIRQEDGTNIFDHLKVHFIAKAPAKKK